MKKIINKNIGLIGIIIGLLIVSSVISCIEDDTETKPNGNEINSDIHLVYNNLVSYPFTTIKSGEPTFDMGTSAYNFRINTITIVSDETPPPPSSIFSIDAKTGEITVDNSEGKLVAGTYTFSLSISNINGYLNEENVFTLEVLENPVGYDIDKANVETNYLENSDIATVTYVDNSTEGNIVSDVTYSLVGDPAGFAIDETSGVISKNTDASSGEHNLSVIISSNMAPQTFADILKVTVGEAPVLTYVQADNTTPLKNVVLSPWTAYSSAPPVMDGMNVVSYEIILPETLEAGSVTVNTDGSIAILADQNLPIGTHKLEVKATNAADISATFDAFTLTVETRWEPVDLFNDTFDDDSTGLVDPGNTLYPDFAGYTLGADNLWNKAVIPKPGLPTVKGIRVQNPGANNHYLVRTVEIAGVKAMKVTFGEQFGYNSKFVDETYSRGLYAGESTADLESGSFNMASWTTVMAASDPRWPEGKDVTWPTRIPNEIKDVNVDLSNIAGTTLKLAWYIGGGKSQNGQYVIDYCNAQVSVPFPAEEE